MCRKYYSAVSAIFLLLFLTQSIRSQDFTQIGQSLYGQTTEEGIGFKSAMNSTGDVIAISGGFFANPIADPVVRVYQRSTGDWEQLGDDLTAPANETSFGASIALSDDGLTLIIGSAQDPTSSGTVRVYEFDGNTWILKGAPLVGNVDDFLGWSVDIDASGNVIIISAFGFWSNPPSKISVYEFDGNDWIQVGNSISPGTGFNFLGTSVQISSDGMRIAFNGGHIDPLQEIPGQIEVYDYVSSEWTMVGQPIIGPIDDTYYGRMFDMTDDGSAILSSSWSSDLHGVNAGLVQVHAYNGSNWIQKGSDIFGEPNSFSGTNLKIGNSGSLVLVGSPQDNSDLNFEQRGLAQFYRFEGGDWVPFGDQFVGEIGDTLGRSVEISDNEERFLIGSPYADFESVLDVGLVEVFEFENLGIDESLWKLGIKIFPNPVDNQLNIEWQEMVFVENLVLYNAIGNRIHTKEINTRIDAAKVETSQLPSGVYFVEIISLEKSETIKFIKN